ncbi:MULTISPECIES: hypothetical protein [unclassified Nitrobacter]|nr:MULTISPECIES: hypothetical protein [unclassified Nitrobacter]MBN9148229.1 hypothetical protein [Nitrobacter sp.]
MKCTACPKTFIEANGIRAAQFTAIGALSNVELRCMDSGAALIGMET